MKARGRPKRRFLSATGDPLLWKAGGSIATVKRVSVTMSRRLAFQVSGPIGRREVANEKIRPQSGPRVSYRMDPL